MSYHTDPSDIVPTLMSPLNPHVIVLFGAGGDLARRKLLPGLIHLAEAGLLPECRIIGTSLEDFDDEAFRKFARAACEEFASKPVADDDWADFERRLTYVSQADGADGLRAAVTRAEAELGGEPRRLHYLSVPPKAARAVVELLGRAGLVDRARIIMEKPFGTNLATARALNVSLRSPSSRAWPSTRPPAPTGTWW